MSEDEQERHGIDETTGSPNEDQSNGQETIFIVSFIF